MIERIKDGGLGMSDFDIIDKSLKAGWVKRLLDPQAQSWNTMLFSFRQCGWPVVVWMQFFVKNFTRAPSPTAFLPRCFQCLESISKHKARTKNEIENEILWNNHEVTIAGKFVFHKQWYDTGVKSLPGILDKEETFLTFTVFKEKYKIKTNFLCYIGLCNTLPKHWRKMIW